MIMKSGLMRDFLRQELAKEHGVLTNDKKVNQLIYENCKNAECIVMNSVSIIDFIQNDNNFGPTFQMIRCRINKLYFLGKKTHLQ